MNLRDVALNALEHLERSWQQFEKLSMPPSLPDGWTMRRILHELALSPEQASADYGIPQIEINRLISQNRS